MSVELIKKVIPFTDHDLETNRRGTVSAWQLKRLKDEVGGLFQYGVGGILISGILFFVAAVIFSNLEYKKPLLRNIESLPPLFTFFVVIVLIGFGFSSFLVLWSSLRSRAYQGRLEVKMTEGKVARLTPGVDEYAYTVKVGAVDFYVDEKTHDAFTGDSYRVYFLDSSDILSVEELDVNSG
jgi:hypothetical protein